MASKLRSVRVGLIVGVLAGATGLGQVATAGGSGPDVPAGPRRSAREEARIELGRRLFFDPIVSRAGMRSCADCHDPEHGYSDRGRLSLDDRAATRRHSQTLIDGADNPSSHWDGAFRRVEDLVTARVTLTSGKLVSFGHELAVAQGRALNGVGAATDGALAAGPEPVRPTAGQSEAAGGAGFAGTGETQGTGGGSGGGGGGAYGDGPAARAPDEPDPTAPPASPSAPAAPSAPTTPTPGSPPPPASVPPPASQGGAPAGRDPALAAPAGPRAGAPEARHVGDPYDPATWGGDDGDLESHFLAESVEAAKLPHANQVLQAAGRYGDGFDAAFGASSVTIQKIAQAIGAYCQSLRSGTSPYDRFAAGDTAALSGAAQRGLALFQGKAGCVECHDMGGKRAPFSDYGVHDTGIAWKAIVAKDDAERKAIADAEGDAGAGGISGKPKERRAFKTPTLRDVARRGPYMHDGSLATLEAVVRHYMKPVTDPNLDKKVTGFSASGEEVADLVSFLRSLSSDVRPGLASTRWDARAKTTKLRFVDAKGAPLAGFSFLVAPAGDALPGGRGAKALHLVTDDMGLVEYVPFLFTHGRLVLPDGLRPLQGTLVPDSCRSAKIIVPVEGKTRLFVTYPKGAPVAAVLVGEHREAASYPDRRRPRIAFRQEAAMPQADGRAVVLYSAWFRTDVPMPVTLRLPKRSWGMDRLRMIFESEATKTLDLSK